MRGLFYFRTHVNDLQNAGVIKKCRHLAAAFQAHGVEADTLFFNDEGLLLNENTAFRTPFFARKNTVGHLLLYYFWADTFLMRKRFLNNYDFLFIRHLPAHPLFLMFLKTIKRQNPALRVVIEFPTWPYDREIKGFKGRSMLLLDRMARRRLHRYADVALHIGEETAIWNIPALRFANGIHPDDCPPPAPGNTRPEGVLSFVFAGNISPWHGLDRLLNGLSDYQKVQGGLKTVLTIIGQGTEKQRLINIVSEKGMADCIHFLPPVGQSELQEWYRRSDVAIGSLGLHRIGLQSGTPLKHREYCAAGLPFLYAGADPDFDGFEGAFRVPADDTPIDIPALVGFFEGLKRRNARYPHALYEYAVQNLSWKNKIGPVVQLLKTGSIERQE
jgi:glycosyltransferase involved in cell wall biosynthesis